MTKTSYFSVLGLIKLVRLPNLLIVLLTQYLTRIFLIGPKEDWQNIIQDKSMFVLSISTMLIAGAGYIINDYFDVKIDYVNKPNKVVIGQRMGRRFALLFHSLLTFLAILIMFFIDKRLALVFFGTSIGLWWYSGSLKRVVFWGNFIVALLSGLVVLVVGMLYREKEILIYLYASFAFGITFIREVIKDMEDVRGDMRYGCKTIPIVWGLRKTKTLLMVLVFVFSFAIIYFLYVLENIYLQQYFGILGLFLVYFVFKLSKAHKKKDFSFLSIYAKLIIFVGILSMIFY